MSISLVWSFVATTLYSTDTNSGKRCNVADDEIYGTKNNFQETLTKKYVYTRAYWCAPRMIFSTYSGIVIVQRLNAESRNGQ